MFPQLLLWLALAATAVANTINPGFCSVSPPSEAWLDSIQDVIDAEKSGSFAGFTQDVMVDTYVHVVTASQKPEDGYLSVSPSFPYYHSRNISALPIHSYFEVKC